MTPVEFFARFGEVSRVLRHLGEPADAVARRVFELHQRHARGVTQVVQQAIEDHAKEILERTLPPTCLIRLVCDSASPAAPSAAGDMAPSSRSARVLGRNVFAQMGTRAWLVRFEGGRDFVLLQSKGAAYLHILLSNPGSPVSAARLASTVAGKPEAYMLGGSAELSDVDAMVAYRAQYEELSDEMTEAKDNNDEATKQRLQAEMAELASHIKNDEGFDGRLRREKSVADRVRVAVTNAITRAIKQIAGYDRGLADHLKPPTLTRGRHPCYSPSQPVEWELV